MKIEVKSLWSALRNEKLFMSFKDYLLVFGFIFFICIQSSCKKEEKVLEKPTIEFVLDSAYLSSDTALYMGTVMRYRVKASCINVPITNFVINYNNGVDQVFLDTGIYSKDFIFNLEVIKGTSTLEKWTFTVMNKDREKASVSVFISLATGGTFGAVKNYEITLGAQNNTQYGHFYSFTTEQNYFLEEAFNNQQVIDIGYYYHSVYEATLSSPNDNDAPSIYTGTYGFLNWPTRNESRYNLTTLNASDFNAVDNDSLLIASYDIVNAKRKGKNVIPGQIWAFRISSGRIGLMKLNNIIPDVNGQIDLSIKIQE